jgi:transcriptional regulator with XRE-family HTH domain
MERLHKLGLTGAEFAHMLGAAPSTISDWSRGYRRTPAAVNYLLDLLIADPEKAAAFIREKLPRNELVRKPVKPYPPHPMEKTLTAWERELAEMEARDRAAELAFDQEWKDDLKRERRHG